LYDVRGSWTPFNWVEKYAYAFSGPFYKPEIALTFDDCPDPATTGQILDKLKKYGAKATFFLLGENVEKYPDLVKRIVEEGHDVANHSYDHPKYTTLNEQDFKNQVTKTNDLIYKVAGVKPVFLRPPYGEISELQLNWLSSLGMMTVQWTVDTLDWKGLDKKEIANTVEANAVPGSIVLQHSAPGVPLQGSVDSLDIFIPGLQKKGAKFVSLSEMFDFEKK